MTSTVNAGPLPSSRPPISLPTLPKPNPLLLSLGSDKKRPMLAHEHGNGSPCVVCKQACPGLDLHYWRKICKTCKCSKDDHDIKKVEADPGKLRIGKLFDKIEASPFSHKSRELTNGHENPRPDCFVTKRQKSKFEWVPPNVAENMVDKFMAKLPEQCRPIVDTEGAVKRRLAIERQLPLHDYDPTACHRNLTDEETKCMRKFVDHFKRESLGQGSVEQSDARKSLDEATAAKPMNSWKCHKCNGVMERGEVAVFADRMGPDVCWHPACFVCSECTELLADLIYFHKNSKIYCGRHFGNLLFPRCAGCDELIFAKEYTEAEGRPWHLEHFCCFSCDSHLGGQRYMFKNNQPYCLACYKTFFARTCEFCCQKIDADVHRISYEKYHWHATPECFFCCGCKAGLLQGKYILKNGKTFCSVECKKKIMS